MSTTQLYATPWPNPLQYDPVNDPEFVDGATGSNRMNFINEDSSDAFVGEGLTQRSGVRYEVQLVLKNTDEGASHDVLIDHQELDNMGTLVNAELGTVTFTIPAGATQVLGPFSRARGQWDTRTTNMDTQSGATTKIVPLVTFHVSNSQLQVAVMARQIGRAFGIYPDNVLGS